MLSVRKPRLGRSTPSAVVIAFVVLVTAGGAAQAKSAAEAPHLKLMHILPAKVSTFVADKPQGSSSQVMGQTMAEASRTYHRGTGKTAEQVTIKITDGASNEFFPKDNDPAAEFGNDDPEGGSRSFTLDGCPALETYDKDTKAGSLLVFVGGRYLVEIETKGLARKSLLQWWKKLPVKQLAKSGH
ncbi:MAG TPA: hypothetical protein VL403_18575 [Candidatus Kryptonia bacterium]|nr:hypothetical protein [Candidatus Kryptonia bacterium]